MRRFFAFTSVLAFAAGLAPSVPAPAAPSVPTKTVTEMIRFESVKPSEAVQGLRNGMGLASRAAKPPLPQGITEITSHDSDDTLTLSGTKEAVEEMKTLLRLFDVKPRQVRIKTRLIEVTLTENGMRRETILQTSAFTRKNNQSTQVSFSSPAVLGINLQVTPHINGDNSISLLAVLTLQRPTTRGPGTPGRTVKSTLNLRFAQQSAWKPIGYMASDEVSPAPDGGSTPSARAPEYRMEILAAELPVATTAPVRC